MSSEGKEVFLRDIWPTREEIQAVERMFVIPSMFKEVYEKIEVVCVCWGDPALLIYDSLTESLVLCLWFRCRT